MKKKIKWAKYGFEFLTVLVGILVAFQLNEYSISKKQEKTLNNHFEYILGETELNKVNIDRAMQAANFSLSVVDTLINLVNQENHMERINLLAFRALNFESAYIQKTAYLTLIESGDIRFLADFKLKSETVLLYEFYNWMASIEEIGNIALTENYYPYMQENFDMLNATLQDRSIYFSKKFINALAMYRYGLTQRIQKYKDTLEKVEFYLTVLSESDMEINMGTATP